MNSMEQGEEVWDESMGGVFTTETRRTRRNTEEINGAKGKEHGEEVWDMSVGGVFTTETRRTWRNTEKMNSMEQGAGSMGR